ncbi:MAG: hypothetical protein LBH56_00565 [Coriobacteriales bacterium]|jgi:hypothetical protein|nr:hypothetical protein [Coriobacteriales bacterium]
MNRKYREQKLIRAGLLRALILMLVLACLQMLYTNTAMALPEDGASPDTPGTFAEVYPKEVQPGAVVSFSVSGYPAGEILNIKVDDGLGYSDHTQAGTGVIHTQVIGASGSTSGTFRLPGDLSEGWHWLRFLASEQVEGKGVLGYTNGAGSPTNTAHPTAFLVVGVSLGGAGAEESVVQGTSPGSTTTNNYGDTTGGNTTGGNGAANQGAAGGGNTVLSEEEAAAAAESALLASGNGEGTDRKPTETNAPTGSGSGTTTTASTTATNTTNALGANQDVISVLDIPLPGLIVFGIALLGGFALLLIAAFKRPKPVATSGIDAANSVGDGRSFGAGIGVGLDFNADIDVVEP